MFAYASDEEWSRFLRLLPSPYTRRDAQHFIARQILLDRATTPSWSVALDDSAIGGIVLRVLPEHRLAELGYAIARRHWNEGYCTEAAGALIDTAFRTWPELNRIRAMADVDNAASQRVMEKLGMRSEGVLRQNRVEAGELVDEAWWGLLRVEWQAHE